MTIIHPIRSGRTTIATAKQASVQKADASPFPRKVDLWFAGLSLAVRKKLDPIDLEAKKKNTVSIISGDILNTDGWQAQAIMWSR